MERRGLTIGRLRPHVLVTLLLMGTPVADVFEAPVWTARAPSRGSAKGHLILISLIALLLFLFPRDGKRLDLHGPAAFGAYAAGGCLELKINGPGFLAGQYSCLFKRGSHRASAPALAKLAHLDQTVTCVVPAWTFGSGNVQLILVREGYGPVNYGGQDPESGEMFEFLPDWQPLANPPFALANGGTVLGFRTQGFAVGWRWYQCVFRRHRGGELEEMSTPLEVNGTHAHCHTPGWGSKYPASLEPVSIHLYDDDHEILNQRNGNSNESSSQLPLHCRIPTPPAQIVFRPVWIQVGFVCGSLQTSACSI